MQDKNLLAMGSDIESKAMELAQYVGIQGFGDSAAENDMTAAKVLEMAERLFDAARALREETCSARTAIIARKSRFNDMKRYDEDPYASVERENSMAFRNY